MAVDKAQRRHKISKRIRAKVLGTAERPRLAVFRSNKDIYAQLIDDTKGITLVNYSSRDKDFTRNGNKVEQSTLVGQSLAKLAVALQIESVVFDRGGFLYHGRVKALADGAREGGLKF